MHTVARAVNVATEQSLMRLNQIGRFARHRFAYGAREAPVAPQSTDIERVAQHGLDELQTCLRPLPRVKRYRDAALEQRFERRFHKALRTAVRRVALADDCESH